MADLKKKLTKKEQKALNHAKLMANRKNGNVLAFPTGQQHQAAQQKPLEEKKAA
jgi:hypothetical protein